MSGDDPNRDPATTTARPFLARCGGVVQVCLREAARHALEAVALSFAVVVTAVAVTAWALNQGAVSLAPFERDIRTALAEALGAEAVVLGEASAAWSSELRSIVVTLTDVAAEDDAGAVVATAPYLEAGLKLSALAQGRVALSRIAVEGGAFSIVRLAEGGVAAAFGPPDRALAGSSARRSEARAPRDAAAPRVPTALRRLDEVQFNRARLYLRDERLGAAMTITDAHLRVTRRGDGYAVRALGDVGSMAGAAGFDARAQVSRDFDAGFLDAEIDGVSPARVVDAEGPLASLGRLDAPMQLQVSAQFADGATSLQGALTAQVGAGRLQLAEAAPRTVRSGALTARFGADGLALERFSVDVDGARGTLSGVVTGLEASLRGEQGATVGFDLSGTDLVADMRPAFAEPLELPRLRVVGDADVGDLTVRFDQLTLRVFEAEGAFDGEARLERASTGALLPAFRLEGAISGVVRPEHVMAAWPVGFIKTARSWVAQSVLAGQATDGRLRIDLPAEAWVERRLDDDRLLFSFTVEDGAVAYVSTMTPLTDAHGRVTLRGDSLEATFDDATLGGLTVSDGSVVMPRLKTPGATARFEADVAGLLPDVMAVLDEEPLNLLKAMDQTADQYAGFGEGRFEVTWPIQRSPPPASVRFAVDAAFERAGGPSGVEMLPIHDAAVTVSGDSDLLVITTDGKLGPADAVIRLEDLPNGGDDAVTRLAVEARFDNAALDELGLPARDLMSGDARVVADVTARDGVVLTADVTTDFTSARLRSPVSSWTKPRGAPAKAELEVRRRDDGGYAVPRVRLAAEGLLARGAAVLAADRRIESLDVHDLVLEDYIDARGAVRRGADGRLMIEAEGPFFTATDLVAALSQGGGGPPAAFELDAKFDRVRASATDTLYGASVSMAHTGSRVAGLTVRAAEASGDVISADISPQGDGADGGRKLCVYADDASLFMRALFRNTDVRGGALVIDGDLPAATAPADAASAFRVEAADFRLVNTPLLAQLLTSVVSFQGLADTLSGDGITFRRLEADITAAEDVFYFERALMSGPALGLSTSGVIDTSEGALSIQGVAAPGFGVSSVIGAIPLVGGVLTSREGEGLIGVTFEASGAFDDVDLQINPLSALAPGIFRRLVEGRLPEADRYAGVTRPAGGVRCRRPVALDGAVDASSVAPASGRARRRDQG